MTDGTLSSVPGEGAELLPGRFALPGLVDAHAHVALGPERQALGVTGATGALRSMRHHGVLAVRDVGAPHSVTLRIAPHRSLPKLQAAGRRPLSLATTPIEGPGAFTYPSHAPPFA